MAALAFAVALVAGCGTTRAPSSGSRAGGWDTDGAEANPPSNLMAVPDATPRLEAIRNGGPNKPYNVLGRDYVPVTGDTPLVQRGLASWYGRKFHGQRTSSGEPYDMYAMTAAHATMPIPSYARVRNPANGREVIVRVNDRGPFHADRVVDLSYTAALKLGVLRGVAPVEVERITYEDIRAGTWMRPGDELRMASAAVSPAAAAAGPVGAVVATPAVVVTTPVAEAAYTSPVAATGSAGPAGIDVAPVSGGVAETFAVTGPTIAPPTVLAASAPSMSSAAASSGFWVQLGAFGQRDGAENFQRHVASELDWLAPVMAVFGDDRLYRLQAGPYADREQAQGVARRVRQAMQLTPMVVDRR